MRSKRAFSFYSSGKRPRRTATPQGPAFEPCNGLKSEETKEKRTHSVDPHTNACRRNARRLVLVLVLVQSSIQATDQNRKKQKKNAHTPSTRQSTSTHQCVPSERQATGTGTGPVFDPSNGPKSEETKEKRAHSVDPPIDKTGISIENNARPVAPPRRRVQSSIQATDQNRKKQKKNAHTPSTRQSTHSPTHRRR